MTLGIFTKTFPRPTLEASLDAIRSHRIGCVQFNMSTAGLESLPRRIEGKLCDRIRDAMAARGMGMAAVSGTFNMSHPDPNQRCQGLERLGVLAAACRRMGTSVVALCTGTRDAADMWRYHEENRSRAAWSDLLDTMKRAVEIAEEADVTLAFEPEVSNVVDSAEKGRRLLDEVHSHRLKVVMDGANLFHSGQLRHMDTVLREAFALLGRDVALAHAKDLNEDGQAGHEAAGFGALDYGLYLRLLHESGFSGPVILHGLSEQQVPQSLAFMREKMANLPTED